MVCPFHFYGICNEHELISGCAFGKKAHVLQIIRRLTVSKFIITLTVSQLHELLTFPFSPILENPIIGQHH